MLVRPGFALLSALLLSMVGTVSAQDPLGSYDKVRKIAVGGEGGWDFLEIEPGGQRLFVTARHARACSGPREREDRWRDL